MYYFGLNLLYSPGEQILSSVDETPYLFQRDQVFWE